MHWELLKFLGVFSKRGAQFRFVGIVAALTLAGLIQTFVPFIKQRPLDEYRKPADRPHVIQKLFHGDGRLAPDINAWFDDSMGFRAILTRLANQIDYSVFNYSKRVLVGNDGWLFDRDYFASAIAVSRGSGQPATEREKMVQVSEFLKRRNIQLIVISTPAKETVYREFLPSGVPKVPAVSEFQKFRDFLKAGDGHGWSYIDSQDIYTPLKSSNQLYFRTDLHATTYGSFVIAKELVNRIAEMGYAGWKWDPYLDVEPNTQPNGSNFRFMAVLSNFAEPVLELKPYARRTESNPSPEEKFEKPPSQPFETVFHNETNRPTLPRTVLFGSSFLDRFLLMGAYSNFKDVFRLRGGGGDIGAALRAIPPGTRYFVFQFWEPHFSHLRGAQIPSD